MKEYQNYLRILFPNPPIFLLLVDAITILLLISIMPLPKTIDGFLLLFFPSLITCIMQFIPMVLIFRCCGSFIQKGTKTTFQDIYLYYMLITGNMALFALIAHAATWVAPSLNDFRIDHFNFSGTILDYIFFLIISSAIIVFSLFTVGMILYQIVKRKFIRWDDLSQISF